MQVPRSLDAIRRRKRSLENAIERSRSVRWQLRLWSRLVKTRDGNRCVNCEATTGIQAHHIIRKVRFAGGALDAGNGITLCGDCHRGVHVQFNRKPDLTKPLGAAQGDDQNEWAFLFGLLVEDARTSGLTANEFYHLSDETLSFSATYQEYEGFLDAVHEGTMSRVRAMHEIWRGMPQQFYTDIAEDLFVWLFAR
jgi:hypothetical protein